jgi:hypothetical protein
MQELDNFYMNQSEPIKGTLLALRDCILRQDKDITNSWKYGVPFFCYQGKMFCYLWLHKKYKQPYIGIVEGKRFDEPFLIQEDRKRIKIMLIDPNEDLPIETIEYIVQKAINFYKSGEIRIKK